MAAVEHDGRIVSHVAALEEALAKHGKASTSSAEIFNTDRGSQFTGSAFTHVLIEAGVRISMDGRGRWMDNVFIERVWRSLKYEDTYLKGYGPRGESRHRRILRLPQRAKAPSGARLSHADGGVARRRSAASPWTCGQRMRVDHMPTGGSETAADRTLGGLIKDNQQTLFQLSRRQIWSRCAGPLHSYALPVVFEPFTFEPIDIRAVCVVIFCLSYAQYNLVTGGMS